MHGNIIHAQPIYDPRGSHRRPRNSLKIPPQFSTGVDAEFANENGFTCVECSRGNLGSLGIDWKRGAGEQEHESPL